MPKIQVNRVYHEIEDAYKAGYTTVSEQGSSRSGKTFNTTIWLIVFLMMHPNLLLSVVRKTLPALKGSVLRDFKENLLNMGIWNDKSFNKSELIYTFPNGSQIEFFSTDDEQKIRGRKRHILYANEANELAEIEWQQLKMRTTMFSIMDYNPSFSEEHWINAVNADPRTYHFITTYKDNPFLEQTVIDEIESLKYKNKTLWQVYGLGLRAIVEGLVFKEFEIVNEVPEYARKKRWRGIDFGYSCFKGDTLITTARGDVPIKDVKAGDYVLTRKGYRRVKRNIYNGIRMVIEKELVTGSHSSIINATYEHKFNANGKWKKYGELTQKDNLFVLLPLTEKSIEDIQTVNTQTTTITSGKETESSTQSYCITQCMNTSMGAYQRVRLFITKILTHLTIALKTLWQYLRLNIPESIATWRNGRKNTARKCEDADIREITGSRDEKRSYQNLQLQKDNATGAENSLCRLTHIKDSAQRSATIDGNTKHRKTTLNLPANGAERHSRAISISSQRPAAASVLIKCQELLEIRTGKKEWCKVYDLEIEGVHEYFANGFLVHNCDPTAIIDVYPYQDCLYFDELCYHTEMLTTDIVREFKANDPLVETISESADPRLIQEIYRAGINIHPVHKFPGSIDAGITKMLEYKLKVTKRSFNLIKELRNYTYAQDKEGKRLNKPIDAYNHAIDAIRYVVIMKILGGKPRPVNLSKIANKAY